MSGGAMRCSTNQSLAVGRAQGAAEALTHHSLALRAAVQEPRLGTLCTSAFWEVRFLRERAFCGYFSAGIMGNVAHWDTCRPLGDVCGF